MNAYEGEIGLVAQRYGSVIFLGIVLDLRVIEIMDMQKGAQLRFEIEADEQDDSEELGWEQEDLDFITALMAADLEGDKIQVQTLFSQNLQQLTLRLSAVMKWLLAPTEDSESSGSFAGVIRPIRNIIPEQKKIAKW